MLPAVSSVAIESKPFKKFMAPRLSQIAAFRLASPTNALCFVAGPKL